MKKADVQSWHAPFLPKMSAFKKVRQLTLPEIEFLIMLAYLKFTNYERTMCSRCAKIMTRLVCVLFMCFHVLSCKKYNS